jgi:hypothetical protein
MTMLEERVNILEAKMRDLELVPEVHKHRDVIAKAKADDAKRLADLQEREAAEAAAKLQPPSPEPLIVEDKSNPDDPKGGWQFPTPNVENPPPKPSDF